MKKKMESVDDDLFAPLTEAEAKRSIVAAATQHISVLFTNDPNPDEVYDYG